MTATETARLTNSIKLGIDVEKDSPGVSIPPGKLSNEEIRWLAHWLLGEGWVKQ